MNPTSCDHFPVLHTARLRLRPLRQDDLQFVFRHFSDADVCRYLLDEEPVATLEQAQSIVDFYLAPDPKPYNRWVVERKPELLPIGTCGFHRWSKQHGRIEIGFDLAPAYQRLGFMTEAVQAALQYAWETLQLNRVEALVHPDNTACIGLLHKLGFRQEGVLREYFRQGGHGHDHLMLSLLRSEWDAVQAR